MVVASINPAPSDSLFKFLARFRLVLTVEAHYVAGGLGSLVSEIAAERGLGCQVVRCGVKALQEGVSGSHKFLCQVHGISAEAVAAKALEVIHGVRS
jgi:transketolase